MTPSTGNERKGVLDVQSFVVQLVFHSFTCASASGPVLGTVTLTTRGVHFITLIAQAN